MTARATLEEEDSMAGMSGGNIIDGLGYHITY
jgi:hypothetical protein